MIESITYTLPLFIFGNYSNTLNWIMMITYFFSLFFFGWIAEAPFLRHSLVTIKCWPKGMYITVVTVVVTIIAALSYHIYLAYSFQFYLEDGITTACILGWYLVGISIPVSLLISGWGVCLSQNASSDVFVRWMRRTTPQSSDSETGTAAAAAAAAAGTSSGCDQWEKVCLHPHHWAIFYSIAYFTRFDNIASNIAAGLCLGSYVHGIAAYGHDHLLEL
ncbi:hypothetical protein BDR26DRAFT_878271 [Obelidium mucronatum]|nr:hypothetical protein BDR26DRAFT_878271 [Obelidium mucronatum]